MNAGLRPRPSIREHRRLRPWGRRSWQRHSLRPVPLASGTWGTPRSVTGAKGHACPSHRNLRPSGEWRVLLLLGTSLGVLLAIDALQPFLLRSLLAAMLGEASPTALLGRGLLLSVGSLLQLGLTTTLSLATVYLGERRALSSRLTSVRRLEAWPFEACLACEPGEVSARFVGDASSYGSDGAAYLVGRWQHASRSIVTCAALIALAPVLGTIASAFACLAVCVGLTRAPTLREAQRSVSRSISALYSKSSELLATPLILQQRQDHRRPLQAQLVPLMRSVRSARLHQARVTGAVTLASGASSQLAFLLTLVTGALLVAKGVTSAGTVVAVTLSQSTLTVALAALVSLRRPKAALDIANSRLQELAVPGEVAVPRNVRAARAGGERETGGRPCEVVSLRSCEFRYGTGAVMANSLLGAHQSDGACPTILLPSLSVQPGELIRVIGASGSGKSTLALLLAGLLPLVPGRLWLDGVDASALDNEQLRGAALLIPQTPHLLTGSISSNANGLHAEPTTRTVEAMEAVELMQLVSALPRGLHTEVGSAGCRLSGGERQRIMLARAFLRPPRLLILDEALSGTPQHQEARIVRRFLSRNPESAVMLVSHRETRLQPLITQTIRLKGSTLG